MKVYLKNREEWSKWLEEYNKSVDGIWLLYYKKPSGKPRIPYNDAVEEALCFGWIDSKIKRVNEDYYIQWFTPRRPGSRWSELNIKRVEKLIKEGRMRQEGLLVYKEGMRKPQQIYNIKSEANLSVPDDLMSALRNNSEAFDNFMNFPQGCRKLYVFWLNDAKRDETRRSRIARIVHNSEKNIKAGMM
jgi:uncharacterized protein YdeI (YjbR/CyaY-like superfamily)